MHRLRLSATVATLTYFCLSVAVGQMKHEGMGQTVVSRAIAVLHPTKGSSVSGIVRFEVVEKGIRVVADVTGLAPGKHGFHIHEYGDCSSDDGSSAGGHFNPTGMPHGMPSGDKRHVGDLGNIVADSTGTAHLDYVDNQISFSGQNSIIGRGVIVHEKEDDLKTQPTGNAGARLACGVVGITK